jgi:DNA-directed RNA polymerase I, II, and III subunit RPABC4
MGRVYNDEVDTTMNDPLQVVYICGGCGKDVKIIEQGTGIRCTHCAHRIFYKKRDRKCIQYQAR